MRIEFWLDYMCPLSYLTHKNLVEALEELNLKDYDLLYRSFQLKEDFEEVNLMDLWFANKTDEEILKIKNFLEDKKLNYAEWKFHNTNLAHQLAHLAKRHDLAKECNYEILKAQFEDGKNINDPNVLLEIAKNIGLNYELAKNTLETRCFSHQISSNKENAKYRGINHIPHLRINIKYNFNSYLSKEQIKTAILDIINNRNTKTEVCGEFCDF